MEGRVKNEWNMARRVGMRALLKMKLIPLYF